MCPSGYVRTVLNALSNETNRAENGRTVAEISAIYYDHIVHEISKISPVGPQIAGHFSDCCEYFKIDIFVPKDAPFQALQNRAISRMAFFNISVLYDQKDKKRRFQLPKNWSP